MPPDESALVAYANEMFNNHKVSQTTFQTALDQFGGPVAYGTIYHDGLLHSSSI
ncbi:MAG: hypothetical protein Ct9H300mP27_07150 [Chloroflexota bacterium]|nr:MAG: hypothetical protein Ct9H300mP27_07150 [Chloroflexota bacterium]